MGSTSRFHVYYMPSRFNVSSVHMSQIGTPHLISYTELRLNFLLHMFRSKYSIDIAKKLWLSLYNGLWSYCATQQS